MLKLSSFIEKAQADIDPAYLRRKEQKKKGIQSIGLILTATLIASIAFGIFGIALTFSGGLGAVIGLPLILISLPAGYLSFNGYIASKNINDIVDNPKIYKGIDLNYDKSTVKKKVEQGTFGFSWIVDIAIGKITNFLST